MNKETMMSAEEFFGEPRKHNAPVRRGRARGRRVDKDLLAELKLKMVMRIYKVSRARAAAIIMVMRIYKVSRARAAAIIAGRAGERQALEEAHEAARRLHGDGTMAAEDFFGA